VSEDRTAALLPAGRVGSGLLARVAGGEARALRERRLVREAQRGSAEAVEELFRREWPRAYRAAYLVVHDAAAAEDIAQEAFLAALRALDRFDRRRPFGPWMHRIVVNRAIDVARARALRREVDAAAGETEEAPPDEPSRPFSDQVLEALRGLAPEQRAVVALRYLFDYTPGEIARALELPRGTVNSRLRRALDRLAEVLEAKPVEEKQ
jgi:RNA polymerase sigma-70 factor, ECF subfamily